MEVEQAVSYLLKEGYLTLLGGEIQVTNKLIREYGTGKHIDLDKLTLDDLYYKFTEDANVPTYLPLSNGGKYKVKHKTELVKRKLKKVLKIVEYEHLVEATRRYYSNSGLSRLTLSNYFKNNEWEDQVVEYLTTGSTRFTIGENKFED